MQVAEALSDGLAVEPLRSSQKAFARGRIAAAAREVFFAHGFAAATFDQIAKAAGTKRSTVYNHFKDKDEILTDIARSYAVGLRGLVERMPGPVPNRAAIETWLQEVAEFMATERVPTILMVNLGQAVEVPPALAELGTTLMLAMAEKLPAFRAALASGAGQGVALARAQLILRQVGWTCLHFARGDDPELARGMSIVTADLLEQFVRESPAAP